MAQLISDTLHRDLREKGLELTPGTPVLVPHPQPPKQGLITRLSSLVARTRPQQTQRPVIVFPLMHSTFLAIRKQSVFIYRYTYDEQDRKIEPTQCGVYNLSYQVDEVLSCPGKFMQDREVPLLFRTAAGVGYFIFDLKDSLLSEKNFVKLESYLGAGWITDKQCVVLDSKNLYHYFTNKGVLDLKSTLGLDLVVSEAESIRKTWVHSNVDDQQDSNIVVFYATVPRKVEEASRHPPMRLRIKQFTRLLDGDITYAAKPDDFVETSMLEYRDDMVLHAVGDYYCLQLVNEVLVIRKKFNKHMLLDNVAQVMQGHKIRLFQKGIILSVGDKVIELNCIKFADPRCYSKICDVIEIPPSLQNESKYLYDIWPILNKKQHTLIFVFLNGAQIHLAGLVKLEPMQKMIRLSNEAPKERLPVLQEMALTLGIERKDFYLKLWHISAKRNADIDLYLIPCNDVSSIKKELRCVLRKRTIQVVEMIKIMEKITQINLMNLKKDLNQKNLKQYLKSDFLRKKLRLNEANKPLDHRTFQAIYNSSILTIFYDVVKDELDPVELKFDPLHSCINFQVYKQLKTLENVFSQFKVLVIEDYFNFLKAFLGKFPDKMIQVLTRFNFLLPNYPFEIQMQKPSKINEPVLADPNQNKTAQPKWFQTVTVAEWRDEITKESIIRNLFDSCLTSKIVETVDEFNNSLYGRENKSWKHGLITCSHEQYSKKLGSLNGDRLYLSVCGFLNEVAIENNGDPDISLNFLYLMKTKNQLSELRFQYCKLYASMHYFMLKNQILPKSRLEINSLTEINTENIIAFFFLENKRKQEFVFSEFMGLYEDKALFSDTLLKFVQSENCSLVELEILLEEAVNKGKEFQQTNQDIMDILITGICLKLQIREGLHLLGEIESEFDQEKFINKIELSKNLALKLTRIKNLRACSNIFRSFKMERTTYKQLLDMEADNLIFKKLMERYFDLVNDDTREEDLKVIIEDEEINIEENFLNLLKLLIYLQECVYYSVKTLDIFLIFGMALINQTEFEALRLLVNDDSVMETLGINKRQVIRELTVKALQEIYLDPNLIIYDEITREQIINILNIDNEDTPLKVREMAKLQIADIFAGWEFEVHPLDIHIICSNWKKDSREGIMQDFIESFIDKLDFKTFYQLYLNLEITDKEVAHVVQYNKQYVMFCNLYCKKLIEKKRYHETTEILAFLMQNPSEEISYPMLVESYIKNVVSLFADNTTRGRQYLQFFVQKYESSEDYSIKQLLEHRFEYSVVHMWAKDARAHSVLINQRYYYPSPFPLPACEIELDELWAIALKNSPGSVEDLYYIYFFLYMGLHNPRRGLSETFGISYNLEKITSILLVDLDGLIEKRERLWSLDYGGLLRKFLFEAMLDEACECLNIKIESDKKGKFESILKKMYSQRAENPQISKILTILSRLKSEVLNKNKINMKLDRFRKKLKELDQKNKLQSIEEEKNEEQVCETLKIERPDVFLNWAKIVEDKKFISNQSHYLISEKQLIEQVFESNLNASKMFIEPKTSTKRKNIFEGILSGKLTLETGSQEGLLQLIKQSDFEKLGKYQKHQVIEAVRDYYTDPKVDYFEMIPLLDALNIGVESKKAMFRLSKILASNQDIPRELFTLDFLVAPALEDSGQVLTDQEMIYAELEPKIKELVKKISMKDLHELVTLVNAMLESAELSSRVYFQALVYIGENLPFDSDSVLKAQACIEGMADYQELITNRYREILDRMTFDKQMRPYVRENLIRLMVDLKRPEVADQITQYSL